MAEGKKCLKLPLRFLFLPISCLQYEMLLIKNLLWYVVTPTTKLRKTH